MPRPSGRFFNQVAAINVVRYPQDSGGGEVLIPQTVAVLVPACVQQNGPPQRTETRGQKGSVAEVNVFLRPTSPAQIDAVVNFNVKVNDRLVVTGPSGVPQTVALDGPPFDEAGRAAVWQATGKVTR